MKQIGKSENPFNPQFGVLPTLFIGRELIINDFIQSIGNINDPNRTTIITGLRGSGKTAILSDISKLLESPKNIVVDVTARGGMLEEILNDIMYKGKHYLHDALGDVKSFNVGALGFSFGFSKQESKHLGFRHMISRMLDEMAKHDVNLVILIDEVNNDTPEMRELSIAYQHLIREQRSIFMMMAGLPRTVSDVLNDKVLTFLKRATRVYLEQLDERLVVSELDSVFKKANVDVTQELIRQIAAATKGYPYLIQLIGFYLWKSNEISADAIKQSLAKAKINLYQNVLDIIWREVSTVDREFLTAMCLDEEVSIFGDILVRLGVDKGYGSKYRERLLDAGLIKNQGYGKLILVPPYMRDYLREHIAQEGGGETE